MKRSMPVLAGVLAVLCAGSAGANRLDNPDFDSDTLLWSEANGIAQLGFNALDVDASMLSGSASVINNEVTTSGGLAWVTQCQEGIAGEMYDAEGFALFPSGQVRSGFARIRLIWHREAACDGLTISSTVVDALTTVVTDTWFLLGGQDFVAPVDTRGVEFTLEVEKPQAGGTLEILFDGLVLLPEPGAATASLCSLLVIGLLRRGRPRSAPPRH